jgi:hypothetical protein
VLLNIEEPESTIASYCQAYEEGKKKKRKLNLKSPRHKILIIGDSHGRGMADKLPHNL